MNEQAKQTELWDLLEGIAGGTLADEQHARLQALLKDNPEAQQVYFDYLDMHLALDKLAQEEKVEPGCGLAAASQPERTFAIGHLVMGLTVLAATVMFATSLFLFWQTFTAAPQVVESSETDTPEEPEAVAQGSRHPVLTQTAGAKFFGEGLAVRAGAPLQFAHQYALTAGMVEVKFANGAEAIIEAPAVFEVTEADRLVMQMGRCSVHAPEGAEGFRVVTPLADVVDLGTRFSVDVAETGETDVQVVEGAADVFTPDAADSTPAARLKQGQGHRFSIDGKIIGTQINFNDRSYTPQLPDRLVTFAATELPEQGVEELLSVTVQRGGKLVTYNVDELIGIDLVHFRAGSTSNMTTPWGVVDAVEGNPDAFRRADLLDRDRKLTTGIINPGGSEQPLTSSPVMNDPEDPNKPNTPGMAVRFHRPVVNGPGPDVVFFDLHVIVHPEGGDPFHVSPLKFRDGLRSHTIRQYDLDLASPESRKLAGFRLYAFDKEVTSLSELLQGSHNGGSRHQLNTKIIATGIDLSDLGYAEGEEVDGLFFQDGLDDRNFIDPVFIGGFPAQR